MGWIFTELPVRGQSANRQRAESSERRAKAKPLEFETRRSTGSQRAAPPQLSSALGCVLALPHFACLSCLLLALPPVFAAAVPFPSLPLALALA
jgi:hypothetical protein